MSSKSYNYYMDETCHLLKDDSRYMVIGALACPKSKTYEITNNINNIKLQHGLSKWFEIKFTKISPAKYDFYKQLLEYFMSDDNLLFRCVVIDKLLLDHSKFHQTHDDFYNKMAYYLFRYFLLGKYNYIYIDYKDTMSHRKGKVVEKCLRNKGEIPPGYQFSVQPINSIESSILQLSDLLIGLVGYKARQLLGSKSKLDLIRYLETVLEYPIDQTTPYGKDCKIDVLKWRPN